MANPMMIQYLVGLCCLQHNPDAVEITVGDMVYDPAAGKNRDVDITVTYRDQEGMIQWVFPLMVYIYQLQKKFARLQA